ncbi:protein S100-A6-like [Sebastes fasciatus]|uniref:protein S100-A6-like n=1 Tax=Sebastes fasciatus TaxID=394691 RepID=UPI003D9F358A
MSRLQQAMTLLKETFSEYASRFMDKDTMMKPELMQLLRKEFPDAVNLFNQLDADKDHVVTFKEFVAILSDFDLMCS